MNILFTVIAVLTNVVTAISFYIFYKEQKINIFSYGTIFWIGLSLFILFQALVMDYVAFVAIPRNPDITYYELSVLLAGSGFNFMLLTLPFILLFSCAISASNISLIRHEGKRPLNFLGIFVSLLMVMSWVFIVIIDYNFSGNDDEFFVYVICSGLYALLYSYFECMLFGTIICAIISVVKKHAYNKDFIVILGCKVGKNGRLYPLIKERVDKAIEFYNKQIENGGKAAKIIPSGGKGDDEDISEAEAMYEYLISNGIPKEQIIVENKSKTTKENMMFSKRIMDNNADCYEALFCTTNYHVFRSGIIAKNERINIEGIGAKTKWYFWPNAFVREFAGLLFGSIKLHLITFGLITLLYVMLIWIYI